MDAWKYCPPSANWADKRFEFVHSSRDIIKYIGHKSKTCITDDSEKKKAIYIFYSTTRIGQEFPFSKPTGSEILRATYYLTTGNNSSGKTNKKAGKISKKLRKSAEFGFIFQEILFPV